MPDSYDAIGGGEVKDGGGHASSTSPILGTGRRKLSSWGGVIFPIVVLVIVVVSVLVAHYEGNKQSSTTDDESVSSMTATFRAGISAQRAKQSLKTLTQKPHVAGTTANYDTALFVKQQMEDAGIPRVQLEEFEVLLNYPKAKPGEPDGPVAEVTAPPANVYTAKLVEENLAVDPFTEEARFSAWHGYSSDGDVTGRLAYANYGRTEDFEALAKKGVDLTNTVVIVRYGQIFRGNKVELAQKAGAVGVIIYSDPADDGQNRGTVYPDGPWRPPSGVQRGSVFDGEGDPLTPFWPSVPGAFRLSMEEARQNNASGTGWALPTIPSLPMGYGDALHFLEAIDAGPTASEMGADWQGGLNITYRVGPGAGVGRVAVKNDYAIRSIWNVIGRIEGAVENDRMVIIGNHRDAWVGGAVDPSSGTASLIEVAHGLGEMYQSGWRPRRAIVLASWDAEEYGLVGSTEWVEKHTHILNREAVAYLNTDESVTSMGGISMASSPSLSSVIYKVTKLVQQPLCEGFSAQVRAQNPNLCPDVEVIPGESVYDYWLRTYNHTDGPRKGLPIIDALGSGSDQTAFLHHTCIPAADMGFEGKYYAVYHSAYDDFRWMSEFGDPLFEHHAATAKLIGSLAIELAAHGVLPYDFVNYALEMQEWDDALIELVAQLPPEAHINVTELVLATERFTAGAAQITAAQESLRQEEFPDPIAMRSLNDRMLGLERAFMLWEGLPGRAWFKHVLLSPSADNQYSSTALPGVSDALVEGDYRLAARQLDAAVHLINRAADALMDVTPF